MNGEPRYPLAQAFTPCDGCDMADCASLGACYRSIMDEAHEEQQRYIDAGVCRDCGARSLCEAREKCRPH